MITFTLWLCLAAHPTCPVDADPTGPPILGEFATRAQCENFAKTLIAITPVSPEYITRFTCKPQGTEI